MMAKTCRCTTTLVHFYHLHALDWVDVVSALKADPKKTSNCSRLVSPAAPAVLAGLFPRRAEPAEEVRRKRPARAVHEWLLGQPGLQAAAEANLMAVTHYLEALDLQKEWVKIHTIFGGKNPHPNYLVGGVPCAINIDGDLAAGAPINMERLNFVGRASTKR
jgi:hydrogenase large subunit